MDTAADYTITLADSTVLEAPSLLQLASKWAATEWGTEWANITPAQQSLEITAALLELQRAFGKGNPK